VASPFTALTVCGASGSPPGFAPSDTVMGPVKVVTLWPALSSAATCTGGMAVPAAVVWGCCENERVRADPGPGLGTAVMLNGVLSWETSPPPMVATSV